MKCCQTTATPTEDDVVVDESSEERTETVPQLPPLSWFRETRTCCNGISCRDGEEPSFFDCWEWRHEQSDTSQQVDPWAQNAAKSVYPVRKFALPSRELASVFCVRSWAFSTDMCQLQFPSTIPPVRENADLTKCHLKSPRVTTLMMSGCLTTWN